MGHPEHIVEKMKDKWMVIDPINYHCCIYRLHRAGKVVYVGQTKHSVFQRILAHQKDKEFDYVDLIIVNEYLLNDFEAVFIAYHNPIYNKILPINSLFQSKKIIMRDYGITKSQWNSINSKSEIVIRDITYYRLDDVLEKWYQLFYKPNETKED